MYIIILIFKQEQRADVLSLTMMDCGPYAVRLGTIDWDKKDYVAIDRASGKLITWHGPFKNVTPSSHKGEVTGTQILVVTFV